MLSCVNFARAWSYHRDGLLPTLLPSLQQLHDIIQIPGRLAVWAQDRVNTCCCNFVTCCPGQQCIKVSLSIFKFTVKSIVSKTIHIASNNPHTSKTSQQRGSCNF